jgi:hypothetical protein
VRCWRLFEEDSDSRLSQAATWCSFQYVPQLRSEPCTCSGKPPSRSAAVVAPRAHDPPLLDDVHQLKLTVTAGPSAGASCTTGHNMRQASLLHAFIWHFRKRPDHCSRIWPAMVVMLC